MELDDNIDLAQLVRDYSNDMELGAKIRAAVKKTPVISDLDEDDDEWGSLFP